MNYANAKRNTRKFLPPLIDALKLPRGKEHSSDVGACGWKKPYIGIYVLTAGYTDWELPAHFELGNVDLEKQERSPKGKQFILEGGQFQ